MMYAVRIYLVRRGVEIWRHLCARCQKALEPDGWEVVTSKDPPPQNPILACDGDECREVRAVAA